VVSRAFGESLPGRDLPIDAHALYLLAGRTVPAEVRTEAVERAESGERITKAEAERLVRTAKTPSARPANGPARRSTPPSKSGRRISARSLMG
jgi:hypothetical protein